MHIKEFENKMTNPEEYETIQYDKPSSIEPFSLIEEVKKYPVLYTRKLSEIVASKDKEQTWELVHAALFPNYKEMSYDIKDIIRRTIRKRWKSLRDTLVKDHRWRTESPNYREKKMSPTVKELQFLIPHIKYPRKLIEFHDGKHSPDFCKLMDDTATIDLTYQEEPEYSHGQIEDDDEMAANEAFYPSAHLATPEAAEIEWKNGFCVSAADAYNNPTLKYTIHEVVEPEANEFEAAEEIEHFSKRKRTDSEEDLHTKLTELVARSNEESQDEDRMFLLSLLSDFKRVPVQKKLKAKSDFLKALNEALD